MDESRLVTLKRHYESGGLSIFCGAGVAVDAGFPDWPDLLQRVLFEVFQRQQVVRERNRVSAYFAKSFAQVIKRSPLIVAKYLKNELKNEFGSVVRKALYDRQNSKGSGLIQAIGTLCKHSDGVAKIKSILTYNFDDLIENELSRRGIKYISIYRDGLRATGNQVGIYHAHGFLPREGILTGDNGIVLSEDAYHEQFLNPFSWSNLSQLMLLSQTNCLLIGISLTDPNIRRLLDVARVKLLLSSPDHTIILKRHTVQECQNQQRDLHLSDSLWEEFLSVVHELEERDAQHLGLSVMWVDEYDEVRRILLSICDGDEGNNTSWSIENKVV